MLFCDVFRKTVEPLSGSGRLISGEYDNSTKPCAVQAILESLMDSAWQTIRRSDRKPLWFPFRQQTEHTSCRLSDGSDFRPEAFAASFQTKRIQNISKLSPARIYYVLRIIFESSLPERSFVLHAFRLWKFCILHIFLIKTRHKT